MEGEQHIETIQRMLGLEPGGSDAVLREASEVLGLEPVGTPSEQAARVLQTLAGDTDTDSSVVSTTDSSSLEDDDSPLVPDEGFLTENLSMPFGHGNRTASDTGDTGMMSATSEADLVLPAEPSPSRINTDHDQVAAAAAEEKATGTSASGAPVFITFFPRNSDTLETLTWEARHAQGTTTQGVASRAAVESLVEEDALAEAVKPAGPAADSGGSHAPCHGTSGGGGSKQDEPATMRMEDEDLELEEAVAWSMGLKDEIVSSSCTKGMQMAASSTTGKRQLEEASAAAEEEKARAAATALASEAAARRQEEAVAEAEGELRSSEEAAAAAAASAAEDAEDKATGASAFGAPVFITFFPRNSDTLETLTWEARHAQETTTQGVASRAAVESLVEEDALAEAVKPAGPAADSGGSHAPRHGTGKRQLEEASAAAEEEKARAATTALASEAAARRQEEAVAEAEGELRSSEEAAAAEGKTRADAAAVPAASAAEVPAVQEKMTWEESREEMSAEEEVERCQQEAAAKTARAGGVNAGEAVGGHMAVECDNGDWPDQASPVEETRPTILEGLEEGEEFHIPSQAMVTPRTALKVLEAEERRRSSNLDTPESDASREGSDRDDIPDIASSQPEEALVVAEDTEDMERGAGIKAVESAEAAKAASGSPAEERATEALAIEAPVLGKTPHGVASRAAVESLVEEDALAGAVKPSDTAADSGGLHAQRQGTSGGGGSKQDEPATMRMEDEDLELERSSNSPTNTETWLNEVEFCTSSEDVSACMLMYIERRAGKASSEHRLATRIIARFCRSRLQGYAHLQRAAAVCMLKAKILRQLYSPDDQLLQKRRGISLIQSLVRMKRASENLGRMRYHARIAAAFVRRHLCLLKNWPLVAEGLERRKAEQHLCSIMLRKKHSLFHASILRSVRALEPFLRRHRSLQLAGIVAAARSLQASILRKLKSGTHLRAFQSSEEVVNELLSSILRAVTEEVALRRNPFQEEKLGKIKTTLRRGFLVSRGKVVESMKRQMADLGRTMSRYLALSIPDALQRRPGELFPAAASVKEAACSKSKGSGTDWCGGLPYDEVIKQQRLKWPPKDVMESNHKEALDNFFARMRFMRDRRAWERLHSTSRLDPLFRTGIGAPIMRQRSVEHGVTLASHSFETVASAPAAGRPYNRHLPWRQEEPKPHPPHFIKPAKSRKATALSTRSDLSIGQVKAKSKAQEPRRILLPHQIKRKDPALIWEGFESTEDIIKKERMQAEQKKRSLEDEARTLFNMIDKDGSGTLDEEELRAFMAGLGYGEEEIDEFLMEVDEDCSGTIEWEEFLPAAGKFINQDAIRPRTVTPAPADNAQAGDAKKGMDDARMSRSRDDAASQIPQTPQPSMAPPLKEALPEPTPAKAAPKHALADHEQLEQGWRGEIQTANENENKAARFWGCRVGSRLTFPVNFLEVGRRDAAATTLVRATMMRRFYDVGEALVYFDLDDTGRLTRVQIERGLARMGLLDKLNSEQLICEINGSFNGKLSAIEGDDFMRHLHWGEATYTKQLGSYLYSRARGSRHEIYSRGRPTASAKAILSSGSFEEFSGPRPPLTARPTREADVKMNRKSNQHRSLADLRKVRVGQAIHDSARLAVISTPYIRPEAAFENQTTFKIAEALINESRSAQRLEVTTPPPSPPYDASETGRDHFATRGRSKTHTTRAQESLNLLRTHAANRLACI